MKQCTRCREQKPTNEFYPDRRRGPAGLSAHCKPCNAARQREFRQRHGPYIRKQDRTVYAQRRWNSHLKRKYGIDSGEFARILGIQGGKCAICQAEHCGGRANRFHVDHNHTTGRVRGLLCTRCNQMLGYGQDNPEILGRAAEYIRSSSIVAEVAKGFIEAYLEAIK